MNKLDPNRKLQFCEWFQHKVDQDGEFVSKSVWSDVATIKLGSTANLHNCVLGSRKSIHSCEHDDQYIRIHCLVWTLIQGCNWTVAPDLTPLNFSMWAPWRMWYIVENHRHWRQYGKKLKRHMPISQWPPWPRLQVHQSAELREVSIS
jgi:hypothetical protein